MTRRKSCYSVLDWLKITRCALVAIFERNSNFEPTPDAQSAQFLLDILTPHTVSHNFFHSA